MKVPFALSATVVAEVSPVKAVPSTTPLAPVAPARRPLAGSVMESGVPATQ